MMKNDLLSIADGIEQLSIEHLRMLDEIALPPDDWCPVSNWPDDRYPLILDLMTAGLVSIAFGNPGPEKVRITAFGKAIRSLLKTAFQPIRENNDDVRHAVRKEVFQAVSWLISDHSGQSLSPERTRHAEAINKLLRAMDLLCPELAPKEDPPAELYQIMTKLNFMLTKDLNPGSS